MGVLVLRAFGTPAASLHTGVAGDSVSLPDCLGSVGDAFLPSLAVFVVHANLVSCFVYFYEFIWKKLSQWSASILIESCEFLKGNTCKIFNLNMIRIFILRTSHPYILIRKNLSD